MAGLMEEEKYLEAIDIFEGQPDVVSLRNIGLCYFELSGKEGENWDNKEYWNASIEAFKKCNSVSELHNGKADGISCEYLGVMLRGVEQEYYVEKGCQAGHWSSFVDRGVIEMEKGNFQRAKELLLQVPVPNDEVEKYYLEGYMKRTQEVLDELEKGIV